MSRTIELLGSGLILVLIGIGMYLQVKAVKPKKEEDKKEEEISS